MISYEGLFFGEKESAVIKLLESHSLENTNDLIHCTFKYHPNKDEVFDEIVGKDFEVIIFAYGNDGYNSGFQLILPEVLKKYYINYDEQDPNKLKTPHITASLAEGAKASNTKDLVFTPLKKPIKLNGRFGYWIKSQGREFVSFEPYYKLKEEEER